MRVLQTRALPLGYRAFAYCLIVSIGSHAEKSSPIENAVPVPGHERTTVSTAQRLSCIVERLHAQNCNRRTISAECFLSSDDKNGARPFTCTGRRTVKYIPPRATVALAAGILVVGGCRLIPPGTGNPLGYRGELVGRVFRRVNLLANPRFLGPDYAVPQDRIRSIFAWGPFGSEWRILVAAEPVSRMGLKFSRPLDFTEPYENGGGIVFLLYPRALADHLELRLLSDFATDMPSRRISGHGIWLHGRWGAYRIPLAELAPKSPPGEEAESPVPTPLRKITGIELAFHQDGSSASAHWLVIRNLEVGGVVHSRRLYESEPGAGR